METIKIQKLLPNGEYAVEDCPIKQWNSIKENEDHGWTPVHEDNEQAVPTAIREALEKRNSITPVAPVAPVEEVDEEIEEEVELMPNYAEMTVKVLKEHCTKYPRKEWGDFVRKVQYIEYLEGK